MGRFQNNPDIEHLAGLANKSVGQDAQALKHLNKAAALAPANPAILNNLGLVLLETGDVERAISTLERVINASPGFAAAHANLGHAYLRNNDLERAEASYRKALYINPGQADAASNLVQLLSGQSRLDELEVDLDHPALQAQQPGLLTAHGLLAMHTGDFALAQTFFQDAIANSPSSPALLNNLALALAKQGLTHEALDTLQQAIDAAPQNPEPLINVADLLKYTSPSDAIPYVEKALQLEPRNANACDLLGFLHFMIGRHVDAIAYFDRALSLDPTFSRAIFHKSGAAFLLGEFDLAWASYLTRYGLSLTTGSPFSDSVPGSAHLNEDHRPAAIWTDQGLGDEILQLSLVHDAYQQDCMGLLSVSERLVPIVQRTFPDVKVVSHEHAKHTSPQELGVRAQCPAIALACTFRRNWESFPNRRSYLVADQTHAEVLRKKYLSDHGIKPLVGLSWKSKNTVFGAEKSLALSDMLNAFSDFQCTWINLQYGDVSQDIADASVEIVLDPEVDPLRDMDAFASQIEALDLVITTSNTTAHMAGALGKPTLVLVPRRGPGWLWYWFDNRTDSPWYPTVSVFRQAETGDWCSALASAAHTARRFIE